MRKVIQEDSTPLRCVRESVCVHACECVCACVSVCVRVSTHVVRHHDGEQRLVVGVEGYIEGGGLDHDEDGMQD